MRISATTEYDLIDDSGGSFTKATALKGPDTRYADAKGAIPTYLYWGAKTDIWSSKTNHIFMGGFDVGNYSQNDISDATKRPNVSTNSSDTVDQSDIVFFIPDSSSNNDLGMWLTQDRDQI